MQVIGETVFSLRRRKRMPLLYADLSFLYMSKIGPDRGLLADFHILQDAIDLFFNIRSIRRPTKT